jgi:hypothetical protein
VYEFGDKEYEYKSTGNSSYDEKGWLVPQNDYEYKEGDDFYSSKVTKALFSDYTCNSEQSSLIATDYIWVPVSGREKINYKREGKEGSFEIDYGNGECDNIIYIIENGKRIKVDLGSGWLAANKEG